MRSWLLLWWLLPGPLAAERRRLGVNGKVTGDPDPRLQPLFFPGISWYTIGGVREMETLPSYVKEIAMGCYLCVICDVFTDHPEQHLHEAPAGGQ